MRRPYGTQPPMQHRHARHIQSQMKSDSLKLTKKTLPMPSTIQPVVKEVMEKLICDVIATQTPKRVIPLKRSYSLKVFPSTPKKLRLNIRRTRSFDRRILKSPPRIKRKSSMKQLTTVPSDSETEDENEWDETQFQLDL